MYAQVWKKSIECGFEAESYTRFFVRLLNLYLEIRVNITQELRVPSSPQISRYKYQFYIQTATSYPNLEEIGGQVLNFEFSLKLWWVITQEVLN